MIDLPVADPWWVVAPAGDGVTLITEPHVHPFLRCNVWHVRGRDRDLVVDTGMGLAPLRAIVSADGDVRMRYARGRIQNDPTSAGNERINPIAITVPGIACGSVTRVSTILPSPLPADATRIAPLSPTTSAPAAVHTAIITLLTIGIS